MSTTDNPTDLATLTLAVEPLGNDHVALVLDHDLHPATGRTWNVAERAAVASVTAVLARVACDLQPAMRWEAHRHRCHGRALHYTPAGEPWQGIRDTTADTFETVTFDGGDVCEVNLYDPAARGDDETAAQLVVTVPADQLKPWRARLDTARLACTAAPTRHA